MLLLYGANESAGRTERSGMKALVVVARGLQLGYVGGYGNDWIDTPALDRLAAEGVVFDQHFADRPDAAGARRAWRRGRHPFSPCDEQAAAGPDLLALLRGAGVTTFLLREERSSLPAEFTAGWDEILVVPPDAPEGALGAVPLGLDRLAGRDNWLLWVESAALLPPWDEPDESHDPGAEEEEALAPWTAPLPDTIDVEDDATFLRLQAAYAAAVHDFDAGLGSLCEELADRNLLDDLLLVVTTDRGFSLGEHGAVGDHRPGLYEELLHLPLLVRLPRGEEAGRRVPALTQPVDLMPTLLEAFGVPPPVVHGHSLWPLVRGKADRVRDYACSGLPYPTGWGWALHTPDWALRLPPPADAPRPPQLFVKPDDRWEVNDLRQHHLEWTERLEQTLHAFVQAARQPGPLRPPEMPDRDEEPESLPEEEAP
jgi:arylsulfatase A-like enzyme